MFRLFSVFAAALGFRSGSSDSTNAVFRILHLAWGFSVCLLLALALAQGYKVPSIDLGEWNSGQGGSFRGSGGSWGFGGGK